MGLFPQAYQQILGVISWNTQAHLTIYQQLMHT